jgi:radical SAM protein with 4Fe4S-binding SPASM domain
MLSDNVSAGLNETTLKNNIPAAVTVELTRRCVLSCRHCYLPETRGRKPPRGEVELNTIQWKKLLGQVAQAGGLYLTFTGGEPLLRQDLAEICGFATSLRFDVRIYSTGLGLDPARARSLKAAGVSAFELSVYGQPEIHDRITGVQGSFQKTFAAAGLLKKAGIKIKLKTPLMRLNFKECGWLVRLAKKRGFGIAFDPVIAPGNDGDGRNLCLRLAGADLARAIKTVTSNKTQITRFGSNAFSRPFAFDFFCGAGRNVAALDPYGNVNPCLQMPVDLGSALKTPFRKIWRSSPWLKRWRSFKNSDLKECRSCSYLNSCSRCPGISLLEKGDLLASNKTACEIAGIMCKLKRS